jgi:FlaA1/EpsC-like NDP-sugar epimerase
MYNETRIIGRDEQLFTDDVNKFDEELSLVISSSSFLVIGGAGSIGQAVTKEIFKRDPSKLHVVDISENNLVELVRDIRSSSGYGSGDFRTFVVDCGSIDFESLFSAEGPYDYILNLSALKHVRSEKDPYTLMRLIKTNILNTESTVKLAVEGMTKKYFCVSTDKAANPVNMMGASKRIMEMFLMRRSLEISLSMARFANVAFSDGSLLHGFNQRLMKQQPIAAPNDVRRYFVTAKESGELCLLSCLLGETRDIFFPKLSEKLHLITFSEIARKYLEKVGYEAYECETEGEARKRCKELIKQKKWPCYFFSSDTTGEKDFEEFFTENEKLEMKRFSSIGIIKNDANFDEDKLTYFQKRIAEIQSSKNWRRADLVNLFHDMIPGFGHKETGKYLDQKM